MALCDVHSPGQDPSCDPDNLLAGVQWVSTYTYRHLFDALYALAIQP